MDNNAEEYILSQYMSTFSNDENEEALVFMERQRRLALSNIIRDSEEVRTKRMINRDRLDGHRRLMKDYFVDAPTYPDETFRRRFRMHRHLYLRILERVTEYDDYFVQKPDATGRLGLSTHQKVFVAMRFLAYGASADIWGEYASVGESTILQAVKKFCVAIVAVFGEEFSRAPTAADITRITTQNARRGFPGMIGSIDCMHWVWKNCPTAWHGQYTGHKHKPTIILEAVASYDTWIWRNFFGMPGSCNDLNVLHRSTVFQDLLNGRTPPMHYEINGHTYNMGYYLADGIYPSYSTIVQSYKHPTTNKQSVYTKAQESVRKDVERAFGVLHARFAFIAYPAKLWNKDALAVIIKACIIMHNMIVDDEQRDIDWVWEYENIEPLPELDRDPTTTFYEYLARDAQMRDRDTHKQLRDDLVEHNWAIHAEQDA